MNEPNSTFQRLIRKVAILDKLDDKLGNGKLDLLFQLPFAIKTEGRREEANKRLAQIEDQLHNSTYGIAYIDATEKVTQLNRPAENTLLEQVGKLTEQLSAQMGITTGIMDGSADEQTMTNYYSRTIDPILAAITDAMRSTFLTKTARSQNQSVMYFRDPFRLIPISQLSELGDKLTRNEILTSNEFRSVLGYRPSKDPKADELRNKNLNPNTAQSPLAES